MTPLILSLDYSTPVALMEPDGDGQPRRILLGIVTGKQIGRAHV